jgi:hypothetical protein
MTTKPLRRWTGGEEMNIKLRTAVLVSAMILLLTAACSDKQTTGNDDLLAVEDRLVKNNEIAGWTYFQGGWVANNISELTTHIDGMAVVYERHGFVEAAHQSYQGTIDDAARTLQATVYNQGTAANAEDTFDDPEIGLTGTTIWTDGAGDEAHFKLLGLSYALAFRRGPFFVYLDIGYNTEESLNILKQFALNIDGKLQ